MSALVEALHARGVLSDIDFYFARMLGALAGGAADEVVLAAALASHAVGRGHVCLDLPELIAAGALADDDGERIRCGEWPPLAAWVAALEASSLVATGSDDVYAPLVLDGMHRLYLRRYWLYERAVAGAIAGRAAALDEAVDDALLREGLSRMFASGEAPAPNWQRIAAAATVYRRFGVLSGGPGTGKTHTVVRLLALLVEQAFARSARAPRILLLAPTGKAAARLKEAVRAGKAALACADAVRDALPDDASTIHRALGAVPGDAARFRRNRANPLRADVVLVDEASMVDLALMARLVDALPATARLVLLGDADQLASVEAGAVLGDICNSGAPRRFSPEFAARIAAVAGEAVPEDSVGAGRNGIGDAVVALRHSYRYSAGGGIGRLARAINAGDPAATWEALQTGGEIQWFEADDERAIAALLQPLIRDGLAPYWEARSAAHRLRALEGFRILCAHRRGPAGVETINAQVEDTLAASGVINPAGEGQWYEGRPILITRNDYGLRLFNGDVGVVARADDGSHLAVFLDANGAPRSLSPARLPAHETVFAMSVHKSQGSEFDVAVVVLPPEPSPIVSRELLYTGVTRAR
ncbi:MAG: exodeoxyribonuclease V subunit alpha, partial [Candidatus Binatia bacterium]